MEHMQGQLVNSSQNKEVVPLEGEVDMDMISDYATDQMIEETTVSSEYSRANAPRRWTSVFDRLGPTRKKQNQPRILLAQARLPSISLSRPHLFNPPSVENQHEQLQPGAIAELAHRYIHPSSRNRHEKHATLAQMWANQD